MEHFVSLVAAGLAEELGVETLDSLALMRLAQGHILVRLVESCGSARSEVDEVAHDCVCYIGWPPPLTQPPGQPMISMKW